MSEVRPWLGTYISCALFRTTRPLYVVNCSTLKGRRIVHYFNEPDDCEKENAVWTQIGQAFSEPTTSGDKTADYVPTQIIAELFKTEGYDGIAYKSAFGDDGYNIALFDLADAKLTACTLHEAESLRFSFSEPIDTYGLRTEGSV